MVELDDEQKKLSDTDNDNKVSVMDATKIQKYIVNLVDDLGWHNAVAVLIAVTAFIINCELLSDLCFN